MKMKSSRSVIATMTASSSTSLILLLVLLLSSIFHSSSSPFLIEAAGTATREQTESNLTETLSDTLPTPTLSRSISIAQPLPPPIINLVSALAVPALCMTTTNSIAGNRACRFIVFNISDDGFGLDSGLITLNLRSRNLEPQPCIRPCPYGFPALFPHFKNGVFGVSNVTHLIVELPVMPSLDPTGEVELRFDWHARMPTLRAVPSQNPTSSVFITQVTSVVATSSVLTVAQRMSAMLSYLSALSNSNPAVYDAQIASIIATSDCVHPGVRLTAAPGLRVLRPTVFGKLEALQTVTGMWHNLVMAIIFGGLHLFGASIARMRAVTWPRAMARTFFPAFSYQVACILAVGMFNSAIAVHAGYFKQELEVDVGMEVLAGFIYPIVFALGILPIVFRRKLFTAVARTHDVAAYEFPPTVRRLLASCSWGPDEAANRWILPFGACKPGSGHFATMSYLYTLGHVFIFSIIPTNPSGCAGQAAAGIGWTIIYCILLIKFRPYRAVADTALTVVSACALLIPLFFVIARATSLNSTDAGVNAVTLLALCHFVVAGRAVIALAAFVVERRFLRPVVWADSIGALSEADASVLGAGRSKTDEAKKAREQGLAAQEVRELREANEAGGAQDQELLQELLIKQEQHRHELLEQSRRGRSMSEDERKNFLFFGVPEPIGMSLMEQIENEHKKKQALAEAQRVMSGDYSSGGNSDIKHNHMSRLVRGEGPMPPTLKKKMEVEYKLL